MYTKNFSLDDRRVFQHGGRAFFVTVLPPGQSRVALARFACGHLCAAGKIRRYASRRFQPEGLRQCSRAIVI